jgi:hypothetical protein
MLAEEMIPAAGGYGLVTMAKGREREIAEPSGSRLRKPTRASGHSFPGRDTRARKPARTSFSMIPALKT